MSLSHVEMKPIYVSFSVLGIVLILGGMRGIVYEFLGIFYVCGERVLAPVKDIYLCFKF